MPHIIINPETRTLSELLGNSIIYKVPPFQRNYSWGEVQWEDLWTDLARAADKKNGEHYMGYVVLQKDKDAPRESQIIDGQQRLVTFSLLIMAAARCVGDEERKRYLQALYLEPKHLTRGAAPISRLKLNRINDLFYNYLLRGNTPSVKTEHESNRRILGALRYFEEKVAGYFRGKNADDDIIRFIDAQIANRVIFTVLNVDSDDVAYVVFETLNARGVELSSPDLLKNHLFSVLAPEYSGERLAQMSDSWDGIGNTLRGNIADFLRYYWMSRSGKVARKKDLYREVRNSLNAPESVFPFIDKMKNAADVYMAMRNPANGDWKPDAERHLDSLNLYRAKQHFPLLLSAHRRQWGDGDEFAKLARSCAVIFFRRSVCDKNPNELERAFVGAIGLLKKGAAYSDLLGHLRQYYPDDEVFAAHFARYSPPNPQLARHIMLALEKGKFSGNRSNCTLEHILPQNPGDDWQEFDARDIPRFVGRIGNLALLDAKSNRKEAANKSFAEKRQILADSEFAITQECADYEEWTPAIIGERQHELAKKACEVWKIHFPN